MILFYFNQNYTIYIYKIKIRYNNMKVFNKELTMKEISSNTIQNQLQFSITNKITMNEPYTPSYEWSFNKMIECWKNKKTQCFWENFFWFFENKESSKEYTINFNDPAQPDIQNQLGSATRCVSSTLPIINNPSFIRNILMIGRKIALNDIKEIKQDPYFQCNQITATLQNKINIACQQKCNRLKMGEICKYQNIQRDTRDMGFEQAGCDGGVLYCWCNSSSEFKK